MSESEFIHPRVEGNELKFDGLCLHWPKSVKFEEKSIDLGPQTYRINTPGAWPLSSILDNALANLKVAIKGKCKNAADWRKFKSLETAEALLAWLDEKFDRTAVIAAKDAEIAALKAQIAKLTNQ